MQLRLQKFLAQAGVASRRHSEELIQRGLIAVNGEIVRRLGTKVDPGRDKITVRGQPVQVEKRVYYAIHKPRGIICTNFDPQGRTRLIDLVPKSKERLFTVGRLDVDTEGLIFLTNDGDFANRILHPRGKIDKVYEVLIERPLKVPEILKIKNGLQMGSERLLPAEVLKCSKAAKGALVTLRLYEGKKRQIKRMFEALELKVLYLRRISIGPVKLGALQKGQYRPLTEWEVKSLLVEKTSELD